MMDLKKYERKNIHIVGIAGAEGSAIASFLAHNVDCQITGHDFSSTAEEFERNFNNTHLSLKLDERKDALESLRNLPIRICLQEKYLSGVEEADIIFVSQVWFKYPANAPLKSLYEKGVEFKTITNLYFELASCPIISVTGTNGKTTTSNLLKSIFVLWERKNPGRKFYFAGNDRLNVQVLDKLEDMKPEDVFLLETSSTQLVLNSKISPHIGIITNITPNHLDDHGSFENYIKAKESLIEYQGEKDFAVLNFDNEATRTIGDRHKNNCIFFSIQQELEKGCFMKDGKAIMKKDGQEKILFLQSALQIFGEHNLQNALAAASAACLFGVDEETVGEGIASYAGIKHRLKLIYNINGVRYFDDTQATTPEATIAGLNSFENKIILLSGGDDKGMNYQDLGKAINEKAGAVILFPGSASSQIEAGIDKNKVRFDTADSFQYAIDILRRYIQERFINEGDVVLISPASAHFYSKFVESSGKDLRFWIKEI
jgi:UDP-N-acetylmuramoylalanine--D-glutamate ligase